MSASRTLGLAMLLVMLASCATAHRARSPLISSDPGYFAAPDQPAAVVWSARDEGWYRRNRRIAAAAKVLTVLGLATAFAVGVPRRDQGLIVGGVAAQLTGQLSWSIADLRAANALRWRGHSVGNAPGVLAVCGALLLSPLVWIAGPIQSALLRRARPVAHRACVQRGNSARAERNVLACDPVPSRTVHVILADHLEVQERRRKALEEAARGGQ